ncbi:hypothetical protein PHYBLDRAFT_140153 [Phycomyces blakesleeanus NRRL 1555(-)]|uniref:Uncharacterized protein n=1 Tax=Phycomyces blakesleeanus (strain ATCC 8743b / DSM 1359 / FGSC 10004 / NBRC 33097 / NRRL 1555) TaxID=763407 RepID=A0A162V5K6_PHYB8|nr:hypothetical protein PHYBLDRAFT_140153 [Phycomyces blakesleeanus NRRL 1555(-)]OAD80143.1 hypothetical protein PHYBLDRAFT_140153 [Phycomyces blakesleeanus NRRL 1555(-)]|eukprot:XP_018298183.1 hypothetical protein PHYBLDRAFT_140153 [Phycomyces blakesleeanus NRRL 1555(-)]
MQPTLRDFIQQLVSALIHPFDAKKSCSTQALTETANAALTQFEKTYVSFPDFVDPAEDHPTESIQFNSVNQPILPIYLPDLSVSRSTLPYLALA